MKLFLVVEEEYKVGNMKNIDVTYNGINFYVIENSDENSIL